MSGKHEDSVRYELAGINRNEFISVIRSRLGINVQSSQLDTLLTTIAKACEKFDCEPLEFLEMMKVSNHPSPAIDYISANITIGETYFFRDKRQMRMLEEYIIPKIITSKRNESNPTIRIWSAGCSSGEEIYTLAMLLTELIPDRKNWTIFLLGTDINTQQLNKAVKGVFSEWSMRSIPPYYKNKYFTYDGNSYHLSSKIKSMVEFSYLNLNDDIYPSILNNTNAHDLVICRNVLIYFDENSIQNLMSKMGMCLANNGYLLLGASDPININTKKLVRHPEYPSLLMRKRVVPTVAAPSQVVINKDDVAEVVDVRSGQPVIDDKILKHSVKMLASNAKKVIRVNPIELANEGRLQEAVNEFFLCIKEDKTNKQLYLDLAMTLIELNRLTEAEEMLKKAIFLDNKFVMAHFQLGILKLRSNVKVDGVKHLKNALRIAKNENPNSEVQGNPGMQYGRLAEILEKELLIFYE